MGQAPAFKRRNVLTDPSFQLKLTSYAAMLLLGFAAVSLVYSWFMLQGLLTMIAGFGEVQESAKVVIHDEVYSYLWGFLCILLLFLGLSCLVLIVQTHRIAGARFAIARHIKKRLIDGEDYDTPIILRQGDYLQDVAQLLNELSQVLKSRRQPEARAKARGA